MIKCEVIIEEFNIKDFNKLKNINRYNPRKKLIGTMYKNDTFECDLKMAKYLTGGNKDNLELVRVIEIIPK